MRLAWLVADALAGAFMGFAALLPSFSAGTAALITNRYEFFLSLISEWRSIALHPFANRQSILRAAAIGIGGILVVFGLASAINQLLAAAETQVLSFFAGLVFATSLLFTPDLASLPQTGHSIALITGASLVIIGNIVGGNLPLTVYTAPVLAVLAVTAMLLPGVSGSYVLLVLGSYQAMLEAIINPASNILLLLVFGITAIVYAEVAANFLTWLIERYRDQAMTGLFAMLVAGGVLILLRTSITATTLIFAVLGLSTYPLLATIQTNKR
jgi:putative membrane protein